jgi:hypothetical protein
MASFRIVGKQVTKDVHRVPHDSQKGPNGRHQGYLPSHARGCLGDRNVPALYAMQPTLQKFS